MTTDTTRRLAVTIDGAHDTSATIGWIPDWGYAAKVTVGDNTEPSVMVGQSSPDCVTIASTVHHLAQVGFTPEGQAGLDRLVHLANEVRVVHGDSYFTGIRTPNHDAHLFYTPAGSERAWKLPTKELNWGYVGPEPANTSRELLTRAWGPAPGRPINDAQVVGFTRDAVAGVSDSFTMPAPHVSRWVVRGIAPEIHGQHRAIDAARTALNNGAIYRVPADPVRMIPTKQPRQILEPPVAQREPLSLDAPSLDL